MIYENEYQSSFIQSSHFQIFCTRYWVKCTIKQLMRFTQTFVAGLTNLRLIWSCHFTDILILKTATSTNGDKCISKKSHCSNLHIGYSDIVNTESHSSPQGRYSYEVKAGLFSIIGTKLHKSET